jgi:hypothetical protein
MLAHEKVSAIDVGVQIYQIECDICDFKSVCDKTANLCLGIILFSCEPSQEF